MCASMTPARPEKATGADSRPTAELGRAWGHVALLRLRAGLRKWSLWAIDVRAAQRGPKRLVAWGVAIGLQGMAVFCGMVTLAFVSPVVILATLFLPQAEAWLATALATSVALHFLTWPEVVVFALVQAIVALMVVFIYLGLRGQMRQRIASMGERLRRDPVTGALTRQALHDDFAKMASGQTEAWKSLIFLDVDNFKQVNDRHGHIVGDSCLHMIADRLQNAVLGREDRLYRYGGDEFLV
ncbi:MAG: sensor domain-containing diguanylate cyclase, partial [Rhodobacteraceae bacterium]|nr:sensor domain-containing diguanylate cyclase [Paracoccaceae bacterium]